jgi:hypothetical protein
MTCPTCERETPESRNFCVHCKHRVRDLRGVIKLGKGTRNVRSIEKFWETGDPAVFAKPGALDYDPRIAA